MDHAHTFIVYTDENGNPIEPTNWTYGKSAWVNGCEIYSTDGNPVDVNAVAHSNMTVKEIVEWHQKQPEIRNENIAVVFLWFVGFPVIVLVLCRVALWVVELFL